MAENAESNRDVNNQPKPSKLPSPKRGALPTPKAELEMAPPFIPETDEEVEKSGTKPVSPEKTEEEDDGQQELNAS